MEGPIQVPLRLNRLSLDGALGSDMRLSSGSRGAQARAESGGQLRRRPKELHRGLRCSAPSSVVSATLSAGGTAAVEPQHSPPPGAARAMSPATLARGGTAERTEDGAAFRAFRGPGTGVAAAAAALFTGTGGGAAALLGGLVPQSLEDYVIEDLETFWKWCPTPVDGLHRCGLLMKLFDYCGLNRKENKIANKVRKLDCELRALGVVSTDTIEAHQRIPYEAFVQSRRLKEAIARCSESRVAWEQRRRVGRCAEGRTPLALWVLSTISLETGQGQA